MKNYIFDFDGTLANSGKTAVYATQAAFEQFGLSIPDESLIEHYMGIPIEVSFKNMADRTLNELEFLDLLRKFRDFYKEYEIQYLTLFPNMMNTIIKLFNSGKDLFVVSSKHSTALLRNLKQLEIHQFFKDVSGSDQVVNFKPAPDGILNIIEKYSLDKEDTIMIGDAIFDIQMGKAAGINTCGVTWGAHNVDVLKNENPSYLINNVSELLEL